MKERIQKIIAQAGIVSRRKAEQLIVQGAVTVNGQTVRELGAKADPEQDHIKVSGKLIRHEDLEYYALNKPRGVLSSASDEHGRRVVTDFVRSRARLYPAGRLDYQSEGLIILTNDGELTRRVTSAGRMEKRYQVKAKGKLTEGQLKRLRQGITIDGETYASCVISLMKDAPNSWYEVSLRQGRNRQIRRMFEGAGHPVLRLRRISIGPVQLSRLPVGAVRPLTETEINLLKGK